MSQPQRSAAIDSRRLLPILCRDLLAAGYAVSFRARGTSMIPAIGCGERITVQPVDPKRLRRGHILLFRVAGRLLAHRLVSKRKGWSGDRTVFLSRGDAAWSHDPALAADQILGRVVRIERQGRGIDVTRTRPLLQLALVPLRRLIWRAQAVRRGPRSRLLCEQ
ncbi:MAG TPA: S24/S26 family peptidase [Acidobacteriota bacterium]